MRVPNVPNSNEESEKYQKIFTDPDFLLAPNYQNSLAKVRQAHPEGVPDKDIAKFLGLSEKEVDAIHQGALNKLREYLH